LLVLLLVSAVAGHVCMMAPTQRGGLPAGIIGVGAKECGQMQGPCGTVSAGPSTHVTQGSTYPIAFQKNLDHFNRGAPGNFKGFFWLKAMPGMVIDLFQIPDTPAPSLSVFTVNLFIPVNASLVGEGVVQVVYVTENPEAPPYFFSCADIQINV